MHRTRARARMHIHVILLQMLPIGFLFIQTYLQGLEEIKKKERGSHAEVQQYCSISIGVTESRGVSIIVLVPLMSNELKMRLDILSRISARLKRICVFRTHVQCVDLILLKIKICSAHLPRANQMINILSRRKRCLRTSEPFVVFNSVNGRKSWRVSLKCH